MSTQFTPTPNDQQDKFTSIGAQMARNHLENLASALQGLAELTSSDVIGAGMQLTDKGRTGLNCLFDILGDYLWDCLEKMPDPRLNSSRGADHE